MAAPKKPREQFKSKYVVARMTERDHNRVKHAARKAKVAVADYVRTAVNWYINQGKDKKEGVTI